LDFDLDGEADCLSLHVGGLGVIVAEDSVDNVLSGTFTSPEDYLRAFSRNTSLLCRKISLNFISGILNYFQKIWWPFSTLLHLFFYAIEPGSRPKEPPDENLIPVSDPAGLSSSNLPSI
jgi:hypothetical protein